MRMLQKLYPVIKHLSVRTDVCFLIIAVQKIIIMKNQKYANECPLCLIIYTHLYAFDIWKRPFNF